MKIKDLCECERPRERMFLQGAGSLSNGELVAILLGSGERGRNAIEMSRELLNFNSGSLSSLFSMTPYDLRMFGGIGQAKAARLAASFELGRRFLQEDATKGHRLITDSVSAASLILPKLKGLHHEECWVIYITDGFMVQDMERLSQGGSDSTTFDSAAIVRKALVRKCKGIVLAHNHPSGDPYPSNADIKCTRGLHDALDSVGLLLFDHIIIGGNRCYSFSVEKIVNICNKVEK